jgi:hypothetical protein
MGSINNALHPTCAELSKRQIGCIVSELCAYFRKLDQCIIRLYQIRLMAIILNADKALIFRITHIANVPWILRNGLHCKNAPTNDPNFVSIGNPELILRRATKNVPVPPGGSLSSYVPFYFTPFSMMMYNIHTGYGGIRQFPNAEIVILVSSLRSLQDSGIQAVFTDRHAYLKMAQFYNSLDRLDEIDWEILRQQDFRRDPDDPEKTDRYQAEALIHRHLPVELLAGIVCYGENEKRTIARQQEELGMQLNIVAQPSWYFR